MSHDAAPPPMPGFPPPLPPPPVRKSRTNLVIIGSAAAVIAAVIGTGVTVSVNDDEASPAPTVTVTETVTGDDGAEAAAEEEPEPTESATGDGVYALTDGVVYDSDVEVQLSGFKRAVSGEYASPEKTPYVRFTIKLKNGGSEKLDATLLTVNCSYGEDGHSSEAIFDSEAGLGGGPETRLLPGRSLNIPWL